ncbi:MAG TPA: NAD(P)H-hydrate dehydratase [Solirubrobacteraceae bacterium]|nr:NAD(P)H-hydrate dehydratase [Solirubrobacteraceae bacterium]
MTALPDWLAPLPDAEQQRAIDTWAIEQCGIPGRELMEQAARGLTDLVSVRVPEGRLVVVCGKGNNGGDGLAAARLLRDRGRVVDVLLLAEPGEYRGDAAVNLERLPGAAAQAFAAGSLDGAAGIVDAVLGTGFSGVPHGAAAAAIEAISAAGRAGSEVIACDVPSGVDASTGIVQGQAVCASATATFHAGKPGLWITPGKDHAGEVTVIDIGIPADPPVDPLIGLIGPGVLGAVPRRDRASTKFAAGNVMVCGGSLGLTGAPCLAAEAAMRAGAGYVTALVPASLNIVFELALREVMSVPLPDAEGALQPAAAATVLERLQRADALVLGPGLGRTPETQRLTRELARAAPVPLLLDADGLNAHAGAVESLAARQAPTVLTPHAGELARLLEIDSEAVASARLSRVREAAARSGAIVVLKGDDTIIAEPGGRLAISAGGAPALATAGTGDVLSGVTGAFLATGLEPFTAACAAVHLHLRAGQLAARTIGAEGVIAGDVIAALPAARAGE